MSLSVSGYQFPDKVYLRAVLMPDGSVYWQASAERKSPDDVVFFKPTASTSMVGKEPKWDVIEVVVKINDREVK